jgi:hypothetical protein
MHFRFNVVSRKLNNKEKEETCKSNFAGFFLPNHFALQDVIVLTFFLRQKSFFRRSFLSKK